MNFGFIYGRIHILNLWSAMNIIHNEWNAEANNKIFIEILLNHWGSQLFWNCSLKPAGFSLHCVEYFLCHTTLRLPIILLIATIPLKTESLKFIWVSNSLLLTIGCLIMDFSIMTVMETFLWGISDRISTINAKSNSKFVDTSIQALKKTVHWNGHFYGLFPSFLHVSRLSTQYVSYGTVI